MRVFEGKMDEPYSSVRYQGIQGRAQISRGISQFYVMQSTKFSGDGEQNKEGTPG